MERTLIFGVVLFLLGLVAGISIPWDAQESLLGGFLIIPGGSYSLGSGGGNSMGVQFYSYNFTLYNPGSQEIYVESVEPVFTGEFEKLLVSGDHRVYVNKVIGPESAIQVSGNVEFNMAALSKEDIFRMEPFTTGIEVNTVFRLPCP